MLNELNKSRKYAGDFEGICVQVPGCFVCGGDHESGKCDFLRHLEPIVRVEDTRILTYARLSLPPNLEIQDAVDGTPAIVARTVFTKGTQFGPFKARHLSELSYSTEFPIKVFRTLGKDNDDGWYLDTGNENCSNWMCLVSPATSPKNQNLTCYQDSCYIYYVAMKDIRPGDQLRVYYAPYYAVKLGKVPFKMNCPAKKEAKPKLVEKPEKLKENDENKKIYSEMLLSKEVAGRLAEQLPAERLGASLVPEKWRCRLCGAQEASVVRHAKHLMSHFKPLLSRSDKPRCHICGQVAPSEKFLVKHKVEKHGLKLKRWCRTSAKTPSKHKKTAKNLPQAAGRGSTPPQETPATSMEVRVPPDQVPVDVSSCQDMEISHQEVQVSCDGAAIISLGKESFPKESAAPLRELPVSTQELTDTLHNARDQMDVTSPELQTPSQETQAILLTTLPDSLFNNQSLSALLQDGQSDAIKSFFAQYQEDVDGDLALSCSAKSDQETLQSDLAKGSLSGFGLGSADMFLQQDASSESGSRKNFEAVEAGTNILGHISDREEPSLASMMVHQMAGGVPAVHIVITAGPHENGYGLDLRTSEAEQFCDRASAHAQNGPTLDAGFTSKPEVSAERVLAVAPRYVLSVSDDESSKKQEESVAAEGGSTVQADMSELVPESLEHGPPYNCDICHKEFHCSEYIYRHLRKHTGEFTCISCKMVFARKESLVNHPCFTAPGSKHFACTHCDKSFPLKKMLNRHMLKHTDAYTCGDCQRVYSSEKAFQSHHCDRSSAREAGPHHCPVCGREFQRRSNLDKHLPLHIEAHPCVVCGKKLRAGHAAGTHESFCTQGKVLEATGSTPCPRCLAVFTQLPAYRQHVHQHTHPLCCAACGRRFKDLRVRKLHECPGEVLRCDVCQRQFPTTSAFLPHQLLHGVPQFHCYECGGSFHNSESLSSCCRKAGAVRMARKPAPPRETSPPAGGDGARDEARVQVCQVCGETYKTAASLKSHMVVHGERMFECEVCHKRFFRKDVMQEHRTVHQEAQFPCPECNKLLKTKKSLDIHVLRHTGKKRFACSKCPKAFFQKINLLKHSVVHEPAASRRLTCRCCAKTFTSREYLAQHELEHTQGCIFQCDLCDKSFVKRHLLKSHVKKHHGKQSYLCPYCNVTFQHWNSMRRHLESRRHSQQRGQCDVTQLLQHQVADAEMLTVPTVPLEMVEVTGATQVEGSEASLHQPSALLTTEESAIPISTYILQEGSVIQPEGGEGDILLYVLNAVPSTDAYEELT